MSRKPLFTTLISAAALVLSVSLPVTAAAGHGYDDRHNSQHAKKHYKGHHSGSYYGGHKRGHGYGHYKRGHGYYGRPQHRHGHHYSHSYYPVYPAYQPVLGFMYYLDQKDTYYDRYGYN